MNSDFEQSPEARLEITKSRLQVLEKRLAEIRVDLRNNRRGETYLEHIIANALFGAQNAVYGHADNPEVFREFLPQAEQSISVVEQYLALVDADEKFKEGQMTVNGLFPETYGGNSATELAGVMEKWQEQSKNES